jgi:hypothetical protein
MAIKTQSDTEIGTAHDEELSALQAILAAQGEGYGLQRSCNYRTRAYWLF